MSGTYRTDKYGRRVYIPDDPRRIDGLVAEDKIRTLTLFRPGNYAEHPTAPVDIAPFHDALQGLGTHVKSFKQDREARTRNGFTPGTLELASTLEFMRHEGYHRYIAVAYEIDGKIDIEGKTYGIRRYHTAIEAIFSSATFAAARGNYTLEHLAWMQRRLDACNPTPETIRSEQERFKNLMQKFKTLFGMSTQSVKLSLHKTTHKIQNRRVQSILSWTDVQKQLATEGDYHGRFVQPNYREWHEGETFYGMKLPWYTIATDRIFSTIGDPDAPLDQAAIKQMQKRHDNRIAKRKVHASSALAQSADKEPCQIEGVIATTLLSFGQGMIAITRYSDGKRMVTVDAVDPAAFQYANNMCKQLGGHWISTRGGWLGDFDFACRVVEKLNAIKPIDLPDPEPDHVDPLPPAPEQSPLRPSSKPEMYLFDIGELKAGALHMEYGNWVLLDQRDKRVAEIINAACESLAPLKPWDGNHKGNWTVRYNAERGSWLVRDEPADIIERVVCAIQRFKL